MIACNKQITATMGDFDENELKEVDGTNRMELALARLQNEQKCDVEMKID